MPSMLGDLKKRLGASPAPEPPRLASEQPPKPRGAAGAASDVPPPSAEPAPTSKAKPAGRWSSFPSADDLSAFIADAKPSAPRDEEDVIIAQDEGVSLALEGGVVIPNVCVAVRGWMMDEDAKVRGLFLHLDGEVRPLHRSTEIYRHDVNAYLQPAQQNYRAGLGAVTAYDGAVPAPPSAQLIAVVDQGSEFRALVSGRQLTVSRSHHLDRLVDQLSAGWADPAEMARLAPDYLRRLADAARRTDWADQRLEVVGSQRCEATLVLVVERNIDMLAHLLAFLEMDPDHTRLGVVVAISNPEHLKKAAAALRAVRGSSSFPLIKLLAPGQPVTFGAAAARGVEGAEGDIAIVCSDSLLPPAEPWIGRLLELARAEPAAILTPMVETFDGRPDTLAGLQDEISLEAFESDHSVVLADIASLTRSFGPLASGALVGQRELLKAGLLDDSYSVTDVAFADAFARMRRSGSAPLRPVDLAFTSLSLPLHFNRAPAEVLWNLYALRAAVAEPEAANVPQP